MDILTKICIVVLVLLNLVACIVFVNLATEPVSYRYKYEREQERSALNAQAARAAQLATARALKDLELAQASADKTIDGLRDELNGKIAELNAEKIKNTGLQRSITTINDRLTTLEKELVQLRQERTVLTQQLAAANDKVRGLVKEKNTLYDQLKKTEADYEGAAGLSRTRLEQLGEAMARIKELEQTVKELKAGTVPGPKGIGEIVAEPGVEINGTVQAVKDDIASINVGTAQGVKPGMKLIIYRGTRFVAYLRVDEVAVNEAGGIILDKQMPPIQGDKVTNSLK